MKLSAKEFLSLPKHFQDEVPNADNPFILPIADIADFLGVSRQKTDKKKSEFNWQSVTDNYGGIFDINTIRFYKSDAKDAEARKKIKDKILNAEKLAQQDARNTAFAARLAEIKKQQEKAVEPEWSEEEPLNQDDRKDLWAVAAKKDEKQQQKALKRVAAIESVQQLIDVEGMDKMQAIHQVAADTGFHWQSIYGWIKKAASVAADDTILALMNQRIGGTRGPAECTPEAWEYFKLDFLRRGKGGKPPSIAACYRRLEAKAAEKGWVVASVRDFSNWIRKKLDPMVVMQRRYGWDAVEKHYPSMKRTKEMFDVLEAVNGDGFSLGIWADFGDGIIAVPIVWTWQDIRSSKILSWRMDVSENRELLRLALLDLITEWGLVDTAYLDNTRAATSKQISGGLPNRYRFKVKDDDPLGIMPMLGIKLKYTLPAHGQSKPVERIHGIGGYLDFANLPAFEGRGTKSRPVPIAEVEALFKNFVNEMNARPDRRGDAVQGKSFDQVFNELYSQATIKKPTQKQRTYCMCVAEVVTVSKQDASITLKAGRSDIGSNKYWDDALIRHMGKKVTVRFDPANLHSGVFVERIDGVEICHAEPVLCAGFNDADAARKHARAKGHFKKHIRLASEAEGRMNAVTAQQYMLSMPEPEKPSPKVTQIATNLPSKAKPMEHPKDVQITTAEVVPIKSAAELIMQAKEAEKQGELTSEEANELWQKGAAILCQQRKKAL